MRWGSSKAFTQVELVIMVVLIAIMAVAAIPFFVDVGAARVDSAFRKMVSDISYARQLARNRSGIYGVEFDTAAETYTVFLYDPATALKTTVTDPATRSPMVIDFNTIPGLAGVDIQNPAFGGTNEIRFTSKGVPQNANGVDLAAAGTVVLTEGYDSRTVAVQPETGEVTGL